MSPAGWLERLEARLDPCHLPTPEPVRSDYDLNGGAAGVAEAPRAAAVLALVVERDGKLFVVLTEREKSLPAHAGQISFPGGRMHDEDETLAATALRETQEEIGAPPEAIRLLGCWEGYETVTGYHVTPFAGVLDSGAVLKRDPREVARIFETPFDFLMDKANHQRQWREWEGKRRYFYAMPYGEAFIWGATAGMLRALADRLAGED